MQIVNNVKLRKITGPQSLKIREIEMDLGGSESGTGKQAA